MLYKDLLMVRLGVFFVKQKDIVLIPFWIEKVLIRNHLPVSESLNYSKLREILSLSDLSAFLKFQTSDSFNVFGLKSALLSSWEQTSQDDLRVELDSTVVPLSLKDESTIYINESYDINLDNKTPLSYKVVDLDREHYGVIIYPEFLKNIQELNFRFSYVEDILQFLYKYLEIHEVSQTKEFSTYTRLMSEIVLN